MRKLIIFIIGIAALVCIFIFRGISFINSNSQTYDEGITIAAGYNILDSGSFEVNPDFPPLAKMWIALPIYFLERGGYIDPDFKINQNGKLFSIGYEFLYGSNISHETILFFARLQNLILGVLVILLVSIWAFRLWGLPSGILAGTLATFDPNIIAHSGLATLDIGITVFVLISIYLLWEYQQKPTWPMLILSFAAIGFAFASKFSSVILIPVLIIIALMHVLAQKTLALPAKNISADITIKRRTIISLSTVFILLCGGLVVLSLFYGFSNLEYLVEGFLYQVRHAYNGHLSYFFGEYKESGWISYFLITFLVKTPLITILLFVLSLVCFKRGSEITCLKAAYLLSPIILFVLVMSIGKINLGLRYILPIYPFLFVVTSRIASINLKNSIVNSIAYCGAILLIIFSILPNSNNSLAYFNEIAGGPENGWRVLSDSNIDWGQGLKELKKFIDEEDLDTVYLSYFGTAAPSSYGIKYEMIPTPTKFDTSNSSVDPNGRFVVAISVTNLQGTYFKNNHQVYKWLWNKEPIARPGNSIFVYDLTDDKEAQDKLKSIIPRMDELFFEVL